ncbi:MAG: hypothetical protein CME19_14935 [Gemmatimonadetes bacterium]|nr:hypothetical protein [Gemmatimonadota bacterium]
MSVSSLRFDKLSMYDRVAEPVSLAIPLPESAVSDPETLVVRNGDRPVACQVRTTSTWPDGSVRWLMADFLADLPGNTSHTMAYDFEGGSLEPEAIVTVMESDSVIDVSTGPLEARIDKRDGALLPSVSLGDSERANLFSGFEIVDASENVYTTAGDTVESAEVVQAGPIRAEIELTGTPRSEAGKLLFGYTIRLVFWAGKPWVDVEYQFVNREPSGSVDLSAIRMISRPGAKSEPKMALGEGHYRTSVKEGESERLLDQETILYQAVEHVLETFYGDFWADWCADGFGVAITQFQAHQNFPKRLAVHRDGIDVDIYPESQPPVTILQGVAKTHRFLLHFHGDETSLEDITARSLQFQMPDVAMLPESVYRDAGVWENLFPADRHQPIEAGLIDKADGRGLGLGMIHWGDGPDAGYTQQGRGKGDLVWTNNEYDFPHGMYLLFAKTGERRFRDIASVAAQHWIDVDFCHYSDDPLKMGGQPIHTAGHVTGGVTPSHEWTEGLLDYYHFTGKREALKKAISIADNMLRHLDSPKFKEAGGFAARETGWAMRGLVGVYQETRDQKYLDACTLIAEQFMDWKREWGAFLAPYTSHTKVRVPFMISIAVNALYRYHSVTGDDRVATLIVEEMADLLEHCVMPDGRFFYKELPSLNRRAGGPREMEALCHAYELSGDQKFLDQAKRMMDAMLASGLGSGGRGSKSVNKDAIIFGGPGPKSFASFFVPFMVAYKTLSDEGLLDG